MSANPQSLLLARSADRDRASQPRASRNLGRRSRMGRHLRNPPGQAWARRHL